MPDSQSDDISYLPESTIAQERNLRDEFIAVVTKYTDIPSTFVEAASFYLPSHDLGRHVYIPQMTASKHPVPNVFFVLSSNPGITRRSTLTNIVKHELRQAYNVENDITDEEIEDRTEGVIASWNDKVFEGFSIEGLADRITEVRTAHPNLRDFHLISGDFGFVFRRHTKGSSDLGMAGVLSKLYSGESYSQNLSQRGGKEGFRTIPEGIYFTMFTAMQEPNLYFSTSDVQQGLMRRLILVYVPREDLKVENWKPPLRDEAEHDQLWESLNETANKLAKRSLELQSFLLTSSNHLPYIQVRLTPTVVDAINAEDRKNFGEAISSGGAPLYLSTRAEQLMKLTVLDALMGDKLTIVNFNDEIIISAENKNYLRAKAFLDKIAPRMLEAVEMVIHPKRDMEFTNVALPTQKVVTYMTSKNNEASFREVYTMTNMSALELERVVKENAGLFEVYYVQGKSGRYQKWIRLLKEEV